MITIKNYTNTEYQILEIIIHFSSTIPTPTPFPIPIPIPSPTLCCYFKALEL